MDKDLIHLLTRYLEERDKLSEEERRIILNTVRIVTFKWENKDEKSKIQ